MEKFTSMIALDRKSLAVLFFIGWVSLTYVSKRWYITKYFRRIIPIIVILSLIYRWINFRSDSETILSMVLREVDVNNPYLLNLVQDIIGVYIVFSVVNLLFSIANSSLSELQSTLTTRLFQYLLYIPMVKSLVSRIRYDSFGTEHLSDYICSLIKRKPRLKKILNTT